MSCSSILRIGPSLPGDNNTATSAALLRDALVEHFHPESNNSNDKSCAALNISNRYFSAKILLVNQCKTTIPSGRELKEDGIMLVFDDIPTSSFGQTTFDSLAMAHETAEKKDQCGDLLRLCVGVSIGSKTTTGGKEAEEEYSRRVLWCLDRGYEYVEADLSEEGKRRGHDERDKDGFARVVEAIAGTVWSSAVMSKSKSTQLRGSYERAEQALMTSESGSGGSGNDSSKEIPASKLSAVSVPLESKVTDTKEEKKDVATVGTATTDSDPRVEEASAALLAKEEKEEKEKEAPVSAQEALGEVAAKHDANDEKRRSEMEEEEFFDDLENAMREASRIRDASKNGTISDDTRRQMAGDAAMRIMDLMNKLDVMGGDDEDEGEHGSSSDDESAS